MVHSGKYVEDREYHMGVLMEKAEQESLMNDGNEADYIKLVNLQTGANIDSLDLASLVSIQGPIDPHDVNAVRFCIPKPWREDDEVTIDAGDNIGQQGLPPKPEKIPAWRKVVRLGQ